MRKFAFFNAIFAIFCLFLPANGYAQKFPAVLGAVLEVGSGMLEDGNYGTGIARITPFAGIWLNGLGFARLGISTGNQKTDSVGILNETRRLDISAQLGFSVIGPELPYIAASYVRNNIYSMKGDAAWNEWGLGIGHRFLLSPFAAIVIEAEHRWLIEHYNRQMDLRSSGRRLQMNFGLVAHLL
jgi:hypothetical protein